MMSRPALPIVLLIGAAVLVVAGAASGAGGWHVSASPAVDVPTRTIDIGTEFEISSFGRVDVGETVSATVTTPDGASYTVYLYDSDVRLVTPSNWDSIGLDRAGSASLEVDTSGALGSYVLVVNHDGANEVIQPYVVSAYNVSLSAPEQAESGSTVVVTSVVTEVASGKTLDRVVAVLGNESFERRVSMTGVGSQFSTALSLDSLEAGDYRVYVVAQGPTEAFGRQEVIGLSDAVTLTVSANTSSGGSDGGTGDGGTGDGGTGDGSDGTDDGDDTTDGGSGDSGSGGGSDGGSGTGGSDDGGDSGGSDGGTGTGGDDGSTGTGDDGSTGTGDDGGSDDGTAGSGNTSDGTPDDGDATDGNTSTGNTTDGTVGGGNTTDGNVSDGNTTDGNGSDGNTSEDVPPPDGGANRTPVADAGSDRTVVPGETVILNGTGSRDPDGDPIDVAWNQTHGPPVSLANATTTTPEFGVPEAENGTTLAFELTVSDGTGGTDTDLVTITVGGNAAPTARLTYSPSAPTVNRSVTFDASGSSDPTGTVTGYQWSVDGESLDATGPTLTHAFDAPGNHTVSVTVTDGSGESTVGTASISVAPDRTDDDAIPSAYEDADGQVQTAGLRNAISDWAAGEISTELVRAIITEWATGA